LPFPWGQQQQQQQQPETTDMKNERIIKIRFINGRCSREIPLVKLSLNEQIK
jgi:hypothetical protein